MSRGTRLLGASAILLQAWTGVGLLLRVTGVRDRFDGLALVFYTTPWLVIAAISLGLVWLWSCTKRRKFAIINAGIGALALLLWAAASFRYATPVEAKPDFRVVLWNTRNNGDQFERIAERLRALSPDIIALAEAGNTKSNAERWRTAFPTYNVQRYPRQMACLSRTPLVRHETGTLASSSFYARLSTRIQGREVTIFQADIVARPVTSRRPSFVALEAHLRQRPNDALILLGDFNNPRQSVYFDPIRKMLSHAFETRGRGLADTWPIPVPVLGLDQVWVSPQLEVIRCEHGWSIDSDHRPVIVDLRFR